MSEKYDLVVIGAGHNGLITASYLAQAGLRVLILERHETVGGSVITGTRFSPGCRGPGRALVFPAGNPGFETASARAQVVTPESHGFGPHS